MAIAYTDVAKFDMLSSTVSSQQNTVTIVREYRLDLKDSYNHNSHSSFITEMDVLSYIEVPQDNDILEDKGATFYPKIDFFVTSRSAVPAAKATANSATMDERSWKITIGYTGTGLLYQHLSTDTVKVLDVETGIVPYNFNVTKAYYHEHTDTLNPDYTINDVPGEPSKPIENTVLDPLLEGLVEVKNIQYIKLNLIYKGENSFDPSWLTEYSNVLNSEPVTVYGTKIDSFCGNISIESYKYYSHPTSSSFSHHRVTINIQIKETINGFGGWVQQAVNQGFQAKGLTRSPALEEGAKDRIEQRDISGENSGSADTPVSDPVKLDWDGTILDIENFYPILLPFIVQPFRSWVVLFLPSGM